MTSEELQEIADTYGLYTEQDVKNRVSCELLRVGARNEELKKENTELKCECRRCAYTDCPCVLSDYGKDRNGICDHFKDVFDVNAELKEEINTWKKASEDNSYKAFQLQEENKSLTNIKNIYIGDLLKAKELLKDITSSYGSTEVSEAQLYLKIKKAEQFLNSEV